MPVAVDTQGGIARPRELVPCFESIRAEVLVRLDTGAAGLERRGGSSKVGQHTLEFD